MPKKLFALLFKKFFGTISFNVQGQKDFHVISMENLFDFIFSDKVGSKTILTTEGRVNITIEKK